MSLRAFLALGLLLICGTANAKLFQNAYVSFELPPNWNCKLEGSEWVCESDFAAKTKEAIIILTAKEVGPTDTLPGYLAHLNTPRNLPGRNGMPVKSQVVLVKERMISNQLWIDGLHEGSEVGPYFTRYLATIKDRIAILVTFSAHKQHYPKYSNDFIHAIESLRVVATKDTLGNHSGGIVSADSGHGGMVGQDTGGGYTVIDDLHTTAAPHGKNSRIFLFLIVALILMGIGGFLYIRSMDEKTKRSKIKKSKKK